MVKKLPQRVIVDQWGELLDHAAGFGADVLTDVEQRLDATLPELCSSDLQELQAGGSLREFLVLRHQQYRDYRIYLGAWDVGANLLVCRLVTVEPGWIKKFAAEKWTGDPLAWSLAHGVMAEQELRSWLTIVHRVVVAVLDELARRLGRDPDHIRRDAVDPLELW